MKQYYELLGLNEDATLEDVEEAFTKKSYDLYHQWKSEEISESDYRRKYDELEFARSVLVDVAKRNAADKAKDVVVPVSRYETDKDEELTDDYSDDNYDKATGAKKSGTGWKVATALLSIALAAVLLTTGLKGCTKQAEDTGAYVTGQPAATDTLNNDNPDDELSTEAPSSSEEEKKDSSGSSSESTEEDLEDYGDKEFVIDLGDITDETLVRARAAELVEKLNSAGIICPRTGLPYDEDQLVQLIEFICGYYTPDTREEIDILYFDAIDLSTSMMNTQYYTDHINYAMGEDDVLSRITGVTDVTHVTYSEAFAEYNGVGALPLLQWMEQKRVESYNTTDRAKKDAIMDEVGQVLADLMKGNGCTITIYDGKEAKEGIEYTFTAPQVLANKQVAFLIMGEFKQILMNCSFVDHTWTVYNVNNVDGVDDNGQPILVPDTVSLMELQMYYNNGCYDSYTQAIDDLNPDGKTFAQITQMNIEGMALNNYEMGHNGKSLTK